MSFHLSSSYGLEFNIVAKLSLLAWARVTFQNKFLLIQDNARPTQPEPLWISWRDHDVEVLDFPSSPDMNPIEHLWGQTAVQIHDVDNHPAMSAQFRVAVQ